MVVVCSSARSIGAWIEAVGVCAGVSVAVAHGGEGVASTSSGVCGVEARFEDCGCGGGGGEGG
jgi:hypothetical protein